MGVSPVGYLHNVVEELNSGLPRTNPESNSVEDLNQGPPNFKSSALNHTATLPPNDNDNSINDNDNGKDNDNDNDNTNNDTFIAHMLSGNSSTWAL